MKKKTKNPASHRKKQRESDELPRGERGDLDLLSQGGACSLASKRVSKR